jgi:nucleotide-binding universal stress UspA family protein
MKVEACSGDHSPRVEVRMFVLPKIVLPVDFSEQSIGAARQAIALACRSQSGWVRNAENGLDAFLADELRHLKVNRTVLHGDPAGQIIFYAGSEQAGLIVLPTHGYGPFRRFLLGSVTAKVLHEAACPVWTGVHLHEPHNGPISFRRILCALNPWDEDYRALAWAWQFGKEVGGTVQIVHVLPPVYATDSPYLEQETKLIALNAAEEAIAKAQLTVGSQADVVIVSNETDKGVCSTALTWNVDLLVLSRGAASRLLGGLRSRTYSIIRESPCPVVSI